MTAQYPCVECGDPVDDVGDNLEKDPNTLVCESCTPWPTPEQALLSQVRVHLFVGDDGIPVIQVDTAEGLGPIRINVNDAPVWEADPEGEGPPVKTSTTITRL